MVDTYVNIDEGIIAYIATETEEDVIGWCHLPPNLWFSDRVNGEYTYTLQLDGNQYILDVLRMSTLWPLRRRSQLHRNSKIVRAIIERAWCPGAYKEKETHKPKEVTG